MNKLISKVSPLTRAIVWLVATPINSQSENYRAIDYLLNGLLTSSVNACPEFSSRVLIGEQFEDQLHIFIAHSVNSSEFNHFIRLIEEKVTTGNNILVIDEIGAFDEVTKIISSNLINSIIKYQN